MRRFVASGSASHASLRFAHQVRPPGGGHLDHVEHAPGRGVRDVALVGVPVELAGPEPADGLAPAVAHVGDVDDVRAVLRAPVRPHAHVEGAEVPAEGGVFRFGEGLAAEDEDPVAGPGVAECRDGGGGKIAPEIEPRHLAGEAVADGPDVHRHLLAFEVPCRFSAPRRASPLRPRAPGPRRGGRRARSRGRARAPSGPRRRRRPGGSGTGGAPPSSRGRPGSGRRGASGSG